MYTGIRGTGKINTGLGIILILIFIYLVQYNIKQDMMDKKELDTIVCHKDVQLPPMKDIDKLAIESIIEDYWKKRSMNKSNCAKIWGEMKTGITRGALGGILIGGGLDGAISGAIMLGGMSGLFRAYNLTYGKSPFLNPGKHT
jgi:hypothetical protein